MYTLVAYQFPLRVIFQCLAHQYIYVVFRVEVSSGNCQNADGEALTCILEQDFQYAHKETRTRDARPNDHHLSGKI